MKNIIFIIALVSLVFSEINFSGDARVRPRLDINNENADKSSMDLYYLYRARLNITSDIGSGWGFKSKIGTNEISSQVKMGVDGNFSNSPGLPK